MFATVHIFCEIEVIMNVESVPRYSLQVITSSGAPADSSSMSAPMETTTPRSISTSSLNMHFVRKVPLAQTRTWMENNLL